MRTNRFTTSDVLLNLFLVLLFLLPQNMILFVAVPIGMLLVSDVERNIGGKWSKYVMAILFVLVFSLMTNINETWIDSKSWLRALQLIVCFFFFGKTKGLKIYKETLAFIIIYLSLFQFAGVLHITPIVNLSYILYPFSEKAEFAFEQTLNMGLFETGGFNERLFGIYIQLTLILLLIEKEQFMNNKFWKRLYVVLLLLDILGLVGAGSRTSFLVLITIGLTMFSGNLKNRFGEILVVIALFLFLIYLGLDLRMFKVEDGMSSSFGLKIEIVEKYLNADISFFQLLFGCFSSQALLPLINTLFAGTDFDFGDMFVQYGIVFIVVLLAFLLEVFQSLRKEYRKLFCILLWMFSNTVMCNYRTSSIILLLFSIYVMKSHITQSNLKNIE